MVDGRKLNEVLLHHQHVLDAYRLAILREFDAASEAKFKRSKTSPAPARDLTHRGIMMHEPRICPEQTRDLRGPRTPA